MMNLKKRRRRRSIWRCKKYVMKELTFGKEDDRDDNALCVKHFEEEDDEVEELDQDVRNPG